MNTYSPHTFSLPLSLCSSSTCWLMSSLSTLSACLRCLLSVPLPVSRSVCVSTRYSRLPDDFLFLLQICIIYVKSCVFIHMFAFQSLRYNLRPGKGRPSMNCVATFRFRWNFWGTNDKVIYHHHHHHHCNYHLAAVWEKQSALAIKFKINFGRRKSSFKISIIKFIEKKRRNKIENRSQRCAADSIRHTEKQVHTHTADQSAKKGVLHGYPYPHNCPSPPLHVPLVV